ncbi:hypothetical protein vBAbaPP1_152 [Acinetobacter phage vB_AbaM_P1]|nr:hypothetical protein vBAbaPP1_152 [Acinetobacter phage vB_AbaM_P1]
MTFRPDYIFQGVMLTIMAFYAIKFTLFMINSHLEVRRVIKAQELAEQKRIDYENSIEFQLTSKYLSEK